MSKKKDKCVFNESWLVDERFSGWIKKINKWRAYCSCCAKDFDISNMGVSALVSHTGGKKHSEIATSRSSNAAGAFFAVPKATTSSTPTKPSTIQTISDMILPTTVLRAEILWALKVVNNHFSLRSCLGLNEIFKEMFPDSDIAKSFKLSKTKCGYVINYGLAPYFRDLLVEMISSSPFYVVSFDESMNKILQNEQMDIQVRFWDDKCKQVRTRYLTSIFLNRPNAKNLLLGLQESLKAFGQERFLQLSMDGPNTNWKVLDLLNKERSEKEYPCLVNIGSCGLHILHGAFKVGMESASEWSVSKILKAMWQLFHDSPARRETYTRVCESEEFSLR